MAHGLPHRLAPETNSSHRRIVHSVAETPIFTRRADTLLSWDERADLVCTLAFNPLVGSLVPGLGGIRKLRFAAQGRGKRGAFRVIYYVATADRPILALLIYGKNEQANITPKQREALLAVLAAERAAYRNSKDRGGSRA